MLKTRILAAIVLAVVGLPAVILGGVPYFVLITLFLSLAAWEYAQLFKAAGFLAAVPLVVGGTAALLVLRGYFPEYAGMGLAILVLAAMGWHLFAYEGGRDQAATDFSITLGGFLYLGWIGAYLIELRNLPNGMWWFWLILPSVWIADSAAYFVGKTLGKSPLSPRLSPKKTWEGYWGGVLFGTLGGAALALLGQRLGGLEIVWWKGAAVGLVLAIITTLGDLGESMIKRQAGVKDSSNLIPGHGGFFDRFDTWLWGGAIGYFVITWFLL